MDEFKKIKGSKNNIFFHTKIETISKEMEIKICEKIRDGISDKKILEQYPINQKVLISIKEKRNYFLDLP